MGQDHANWLSQHPEYTEKIIMNDDQFLLPGFVDTHIHAPQVAQIGLGLDMPLLDWLSTYTFPLEAKFRDQEFAQKVYSKVIVSIFHISIAIYYLILYSNVKAFLFN